jgi:tetratricopeptide (TPR) repeat protein
MEYPESMVKQLKIIKWLLIFITASVFIAASCVAFVVLQSINLVESSLADNSCDEKSFRDKVSNLVDEGKLEEAIKLANERIKSYPNDEDGYWYRGKAYYLQKKWQPAIDDFNKTEELVPSWKEQYTEPYRAAAQSKLANR